MLFMLMFCHRHWVVPVIKQWLESIHACCVWGTAVKCCCRPQTRVGCLWLADSRGKSSGSASL